MSLGKCSQTIRVVCSIFLLMPMVGTSSAESWRDDAEVMIAESCAGCHDSQTETRLDFTSLGNDLNDEATFRRWVQVFDRVQRGEMPPESETPIDEPIRQTALQSIRRELTRINLEEQIIQGRVPSRRLTRDEYEHTLHDLLGIGGDLSKNLPPENEAGNFDTVAASQEMSSVHVRGLLATADLALDEAIQLGPQPPLARREIDYFHSPYIQMWVDRPTRRGGGTIFKTDRDVVTFRGENFVFQSDHNGFVPSVAGQYRVTIKAAAYQPRSSITVSLKRQNDEQGDSGLVAAWDLTGDDFREVSTTTYLRPDDYIYVSADELEPAPDGKVIYGSQPASQFGGEGVRIRSVHVQGPLETVWPPQRTRDLLLGIEWKKRDNVDHRWHHRQYRKRRPPDQAYDAVLTRSPREHLRTIVEAFATKAFQRPLSDREIDDLVALANPYLEASDDQHRDFIEAVRIPLRAILVAPEVIFLNDASADRANQHDQVAELSDNALAKRLSYFLWRSRPDEELQRLAEQGKISDSEVLKTQVNRMLDDPRSNRFVNALLDQWLDLDQIDATTPDVYLYPEYDDVLRSAMLAETRQFFSHLIEENLSSDNLIDSDFTFLNRRLAEHYGIDGVEGETVRKVALDSDRVRGGILGHAAIAKVSANGTVTTPVKRGNFVLTNLLGLPPNPPPPGVGAIEPDTRGATTIREMLTKHQEVKACAACHCRIDPPGFAMECFDPVGHFRDRYRNSKGVKRPPNVGLRFAHKDYDMGPKVDCSGTTEDGFEFDGIREYKKHLMKSRRQIARNLLSRLITFSTGGEIEFADRQEIERILDEIEADGYPLRSMIHQMVHCRMFRNR